MTLTRSRALPAIVAAFVLVLALAVPAFAVESADLDWSADLTTGLAGITAGIAASIGAVFLIAVLVRMTFRAAVIALTALHFIKPK
jgi:branched-subunit amino acid transport protein